jgi:hypothetical protein
MNLKKWFTPTPGTGALLDTRTETEQQKDYCSVEAYATANPVNWVEKSEDTWRKFPTQNQNGSGSCVANTIKKIMGVMLWLRDGVYARFSASHVYQRRAGKPVPGMSGVDAFDIAMTGVTLEELASSEGMSDSQMDSVNVSGYKEDVGKVFAIGGHVGIPTGDIDQVASVIQTTGKAVMVWFYFTSNEWSQFIPTINVDLSGAGDARSLRHSVAAVDFTMYQGKKALVIEDSAWFGGLNRRLITEDFYKVRNFFARYPMNFKFDPQAAPVKPTFKFSTTLTFITLDLQGNISDTEKNETQKPAVKALQDILKYEGLLATNVESTGYFGAITAKAVMAFQKKYAVAPIAELDALMGRSVGPATIKKLNELYGSN